MNDLSNKRKDKTLAFKVTDEFHTEVKQFCDDREWNMSRFLERAVAESMARVVKKEK